jgi:hypothetical protein
MSLSTSSNFLKFGRYEGLWKDEEDSKWECELVIDENNFKPHKEIDKYPYAFDGYLEWRSTKMPEKYKQWLGSSAKEKVRGYFFNNAENNYEFMCIGYEVHQSIDQRDTQNLGENQ